MPKPQDIMAVIDNGVAAGSVIDNSVSYGQLLCGVQALDDQVLKSLLHKELSAYWIDEYEKMIQGTSEILEFSDSVLPISI